MTLPSSSEVARELACTIGSLLNYQAISETDANNFAAVIQEIASALAAARAEALEEAANVAEKAGNYFSGEQVAQSIRALLHPERREGK